MGFPQAVCVGTDGQDFHGLSRLLDQDGRSWILLAWEVVTVLEFGDMKGREGEGEHT